MEPVLVLSASDVKHLLCNEEEMIIETIKEAYTLHHVGLTRLPHASFLTFPTPGPERIISLPAYIGGQFEIAGMKWIASFPQNVQRGRERASAIIVLNASSSGCPIAVMEGSVVSAKRTAASAVLALRHLRQPGRDLGVGLIGCGRINLEVLSFIVSAVTDKIVGVKLFDSELDRARIFQEKCNSIWSDLDVSIVDSLSAVFKSSSVLSFATTATTPYVHSIEECPVDSLILHLSLRDLAPELILELKNIVDDVDHVCSANTSVHLAEQLSKSRGFISGTLAQSLGQVGQIAPIQSRTVFSPFGLGVLDVALGKRVFDLALRRNVGTWITDFLPGPWAPPLA